MLYSVPGVDCLFTNSWLILLFYVDDFVMLYRADNEEKFEAALLLTCEIRNLGYLSWFSGIRIIRSDGNLYLCQDHTSKRLSQNTVPPPHGLIQKCRYHWTHWATMMVLLQKSRYMLINSASDRSHWRPPLVCHSQLPNSLSILLILHLYIFKQPIGSFPISII